MIRMLHFADVHIGVENYGRTDPQTGVSSRVRDFLKRMDEMVHFARENSVDLAVFAGDAFKNHQPNPTFQREFAWRISDLCQLCPIVLLVGNHDIPSIPQRASSVEIYETLGVPNVLVGAEYDLHEIPTKSGPVQVATAPYPIRSRLLDGQDTHGMTIAQVDALLQEQLQLILRGLAHRAAQSDVPRVLTGHFTVSGASFGSERNVMVGRDSTILLSELADPTWDYVALGHIHKHQNLTHDMRGKPPVVYSGSMERIDFGEEGDEKGFCWVELERGNTRWEFIPVNARRFTTLRIDVRQADEPTQKVVEAIKQHHRHNSLEEAVVKVIVQATVETEAKLRESEIQRALQEAKVSTIAAIQKEVERPPRSRLGSSPEGMSSEELLKRYFETKKIPTERIDFLMQRAHEFLME